MRILNNFELFSEKAYKKKDMLGYSSFFADRIEISRGLYTPPMKTSVAEIPTVIVDPHNEVFSFWWKMFKGSHRNSQTPATLIHVDAHEDMGCGSRTLESLVSEGRILTIEEYAKNHLDIASFISPAIYYDIVDSVYFFDPRKNGEKRQVYVFNTTTIREKGGRIFWDELTNKFIHSSELAQDLQTFQGPIILDIDLDAFDCIYDRKNNLKYDRKNNLKIVNARLSYTNYLLEQLPTPSLITIARSQTPGIYCSSDSVNYLQERTIEMLRGIYTGRQKNPERDTKYFCVSCAV